MGLVISLFNEIQQYLAAMNIKSSSNTSQIIKLYLQFFSIASVLSITACVPNTESMETDINVAITDKTYQKIIDLQDLQDSKALYPFFRDESPAYRYHAVLAFASLKDKTAIDSLIRMLNDPILEVRAAAAYALGQTGEAKAVTKLIASFRGKDTLEVNNIFNANVLEAVGKLGNLNDLKALATVKTYRTTDSLLLLGQSRAIYNMALRGITADEGTSRMVDLLYIEATPEEVKLVAANYLARAKNINLSISKIRLAEIFSKTRNPDIAMALATSFGKAKDIDLLPALKARFITEKDDRVKINIIRAIGNFPYIHIKDNLLAVAKDSNIVLAQTAAKIFVTNGIIEDVPLYAAFDTVTTPWQVRSAMNGAVLAHAALYFTKYKTFITDKILSNLKESTTIYAKATYLEAISRDPYNFQVLIDNYNTQSDQLLKIACLEGLVNILKNPLFFKAFGNNYGKVKGDVLSMLITAIKSGDPGQVAVASITLREPSLGWKEWVRDFSFFVEGISRLKMPKDVEAIQELGQTLAYFEGKVYNPTPYIKSKTIDWPLLATLSDSSIAAVKTTNGLIRIQLDRKSAPATVANFVQLVNDKFYNNKVFHRIVPNFVIQTGCPRGDGYGSLDYMIRSELPQRYYDRSGYVGMASAGNHTECTQWFITQSPALHLSGNYTIFGKVIEGMDVVNTMKIGDKINDIILVK